MAANMTTCEAIWLCKLIIGFFDQKLDPTVIYCDIQSCIKLSQNPMFHDKSKHIEIKYHFIKDCVEKGIVKLWYILTEEHIAYILTKALVKNKFVFFRDKLSVVQNTLLRGSVDFFCFSMQLGRWSCFKATQVGCLATTLVFIL